nr:hypothetical protein GCM10020093_057180 [Planobispora longispora]
MARDAVTAPLRGGGRVSPGGGSAFPGRSRAFPAGRPGSEGEGRADAADTYAGALRASLGPTLYEALYAPTR